MSRQDQYNVTVSIAGNKLGTFDKLTGGDMDSEETKYKPGNMAPQLSLGGSQTISNVIVTRLFELGRDLPIIHELMYQCGRAEATAVKQSLDTNGAPFGKPLVYQGKLKKCTPPPADSEATNAPALMELEISTSGTVS